MKALWSRKLLAAFGAMVTISGLIIGLAIINSGLLVENKELLLAAIVIVGGLGGFAVQKQAELDAK